MSRVTMGPASLADTQPGFLRVRERRPVPGERSRFGRGVLLVTVLAATTLAYAPALLGWFLVDDFWHLANAAHLTAENLLRPWVYSGHDVEPYWFASRRIYDLTEETFFRPLVALAYAAALALWGTWATGFHLVNLGLHVATTALVFWLAGRLFDRPWQAALAAAAFGLHPAHYEAVTWIAANADLLMAFFGVLTVCLYAEADRTPHRRTLCRIAGVPAFVLALVAKEMAVVVPAVLIAYDLLCTPGGWRTLRARWSWHLPYWVIVLPYVAWRLPAAAGVHALHDTGSYMIDPTRIAALPAMAVNFAYGVFEFLFLYPVVPIDVADRLGANIWWVAAVALVAVVLVAWWFDRLAGAARAPFRFGVAWIAVTFGPFVFLQPSQRILHFPEAGFALMLAAVAAGLAARWQTRAAALRVGRIGLAALLVIYAAVSAMSAWGMTQATLGARLEIDALKRAVATVPPGTDVYLIDFWQLGWMFEHLLAVEDAGRTPRFHVLDFDDSILPPSAAPVPDWMLRWSELVYGPEHFDRRSDITWSAPRTLTLRREKARYFSGIIAQQMPAAPIAAQPGRRIDAGPFYAWTLSRDAEGPTALRFEWKAAPPPGTVFLQWDHDHWQQVQPPPDWAE